MIRVSEKSRLERIELLTKQSGIFSIEDRSRLNLDVDLMRSLNAVMEGGASDRNLAIAYTEAIARLGTTDKAGIELLLEELLCGWEARVVSETNCEMQSMSSIATRFANCKKTVTIFVRHLLAKK